MKAFSVFLYSLVSYAIGMGGLVWFILYQGDFLIPNTINSGVSVSLADGLLINIGLMLLWGVQHSVMARPGFKVVLTKLIPATAERSCYTLASGLCLVAIVFYWQGNSTLVWNAAGMELPLRILSLAGWGLTVWATFEIDHFDLFGLKKPFCALRGTEAQEKQFITPFLYRGMRHPIQTGVLIGMWSQAAMSQGQLLLTVTMTIYVFIGLYFEERDLVAHFGDRYRTYMDQVPRLFPRPGKRISGRDTTN
jgi:protein-S-isoprenylcysteine O-methyltransferase Ste14